MKSTQLLSVVLSIIMISGTFAGTSAFAESEGDYDDRVREAHFNELRNLVNDFCELETEEEKQRHLEIHPLVSSFNDMYEDHCEMSEDKRDAALDASIKKEDYAGYDDYDDRERDYDDHDDDRNDRHYDLEDRLEDYCEMTGEEKEAFFVDHPRIAQFQERLGHYCELSEDDLDDAIEDFIEEHIPEARSYDLDDVLDRYCDMTDEEKMNFISMHEKAEDHVAKMDAYCELSEDEQDAFIDEHEDEFRMHHDQEMKEKHKIGLADRTYSKLCGLSDTELAAEINDLDVQERISDWCEIDSEGRESFKSYYHEFTGMDLSEKYRDTVHEMKEKHRDAVHEMKEEKHELSPRLKEMIMNKHDIKDERMEEIKMKYKEKHGDLTDKKRSELKMKYKDHMSSIKVKMSDEHKSAIHDRIAEMKAFKAELREKASGMTLEEKQQLRAEFIEKAKDMQLAWISPRIQMAVGIDAADVECREGFSLVMKATNGVSMCLKSDTALKMIEKGIAVPAN